LGLADLVVVAVYAPAERADTLALFHLYSYVLCGYEQLECNLQPLLTFFMQFLVNLKGLGHQMDMAFVDMYG
jgi:hypothetical protein